MTASREAMAGARRGAYSTGGVIVAIGAVLALTLALPLATVTTKYVNDLFIFLDGASRISFGQVPNVDFHSSLGPLAYWIPALGYALTGSLGAAMPVGMGLLTVAIACVAAHVIGSRLRPLIGLPLALFLLLTVAVPMNPGESLRELSFAMFYNRIGWAALGLLFVMYLPPVLPRTRQSVADAGCAALLVLLTTYLKISYGLVSLGYLAFLLTDRRQWRCAALAVAGTLAAALLIELAWGGTANHLADLGLASAVSGDVPSFRTLVQVAQRNLHDLAVFGLFAALLLACRRKPRDILFLVGSVGSGVLLIEQNFQSIGILTLGAAAAVLAEALARSEARWAAGLPLLLLGYLAPIIGQFALATGLHSLQALARAGDPIPLPSYADVRLVRLWTEGPYPMFVRYNETLRDGADALADIEGAERVLVLDFVGPFTAGLGLEPPRGDSTWYHWDRTIDGDHHPAPSSFFGNARIVMDPKVPIERWTAEGLRRIYADALATRYRLIAETEFWRIYAERDSGVASASSRPSRTINRQSTTAQP